jgi:hypothetical protein
MKAEQINPKTSNRKDGKKAATGSATPKAPRLDDAPPSFNILAENIAPRSLPVSASEARRQGKDTVYPPKVFNNRINAKNPRWAGYRPRWLRESEKTVRISPAEFQHYRAHVHCMTVAQCAAFLRVDAATVAKWETGLDDIPYAAYMTLRFATELEYLPHEIKGWADFEIIGAGPDVGKLLDRRTGEMVSRAEITTIRYVYASASQILTENLELKRQITALVAETKRLRGLRQMDGVSRELQAMQERMSALLDNINEGVALDINHGTFASQLEEVAA